jgi:O-antigen ligase
MMMALGTTAELESTPTADRETTAVRVVQVLCVAVMVFPAYYVIKAVGGDGYVAAIVAYLMLAGWIAASLFGYHNPLSYRYPVRIVLWLTWFVSLVSYALMDQSSLTPAELASADRWFMQLAVVSGIVLVTAEYLPTIRHIRQVLRVLSWAGAFCGVVATLQFSFSYDLTPYLKYVLPGFSFNTIAAGNAGIGVRGALNRVPGTASDPIELGVVAGMLLPIAIYLAIHDTERKPLRRWLPVVLIGLCIPASVSRSAVIAVAISIGVLVVALPSVHRLVALSLVPVALAAVFVTAHGLIGTLRAYFLAGTSDPSISHRINAYPFVESLIRQAPWFGRGGGAYIAANQTQIFDNQYLTEAVELGLVGLAVLVFFNVWPAIAALVARYRADIQELRDLCAALAGAELAATICSATFDSLSFPMFVTVQALVLGLIGAAWLLVHKQLGIVRTLQSLPRSGSESRLPAPLVGQPAGPTFGGN